MDAGSSLRAFRRDELIGTPVVLHYANGHGYWIAPMGDSHAAITDVHSTPTKALDEYARLAEEVAR